MTTPTPPYGQPYGQDPYGQQPQSGAPYGGQQYPAQQQPGYPAQQPYPGQPYAGGQYGQPGVDPATGMPLSDKSKMVAGLLNIFIAGVGRMYAGQVGIGVAQLLVAIFTCGIGSLWSIIDGIMILVNGGVDGQGRRLRD